MIIKILTFTCLTLLIIVQSSFAQGSVSLGLTQVLEVEVDRDNLPTTLHIRLNTTNVEVKYSKGTRVTVSGSVKLGIPNLFFLEVLIKKGRYMLYMSPSGNGLRIEDKDRQHMVLQGETCEEIVSYTLYVPETITTVVFENAKTGDSNIIAMNNNRKDEPATPVPSTDSQVKIKDK